MTELDETDRMAREAMLVATKQISAAVQQEVAAEKKDLATLAKLRAFDTLLHHVGLLQLKEPEEATPVLEEVLVCYAKSKGDGEDSDDEMNGETSDTYVDVLVDILLSLLVKPSNLLRDLSKQVFSAFCGHLTKSSLLDLLAVVSSKKDDDEEKDDEGDEEDSDDEFKAITPEEAAAAAKRIAGLDDAMMSVPTTAGERPDMDSEDEDEEIVNLDTLGDLLMGEPDADELNRMRGQQAEMEAYDSQLANIVTLRKAKRENAKAVAKETLHFKLRVVDLIEIFLKKQCSNPLVLHTVEPLIDALGGQGGRTPDNKPLHDRVMSVYKKRLCKSKDCPRITKEGDESGVQLSTVRELMGHLMTRATKTLHRDTLSLISAALQYLTRVSAPSYAATGGEVAKADEKQAVWLTTLYGESLRGYVGSKKSRLNTVFFSSFVQQCPKLGARLLPALLELAAAQQGGEPAAAESSKKKSKKSKKQPAPQPVVVPASTFLRTDCFVLAEAALRGSKLTQLDEDAEAAVGKALLRTAQAAGSSDKLKGTAKLLKAALKMGSAALAVHRRASGEASDCSTIASESLQQTMSSLPEELQVACKAASNNFARLAGWAVKSAGSGSKRKRSDAGPAKQKAKQEDAMVDEEEEEKRPKRHRGNRGGKHGNKAKAKIAHIQAEKKRLQLQGGDADGDMNMDEACKKTEEPAREKLTPDTKATPNKKKTKKSKKA